MEHGYGIETLVSVIHVFDIHLLDLLQAQTTLGILDRKIRYIETVRGPAPRPRRRKENSRSAADILDLSWRYVSLEVFQILLAAQEHIPIVNWIKIIPTRHIHHMPVSALSPEIFFLVKVNQNPRWKRTEEDESTILTLHNAVILYPVFGPPAT
jgi:hypothetical protein